MARPEGFELPTTWFEARYSFRQILLISSLILCPTVASLLTCLNGDNGTATDPVSMHRRQISEKNGRGVHYIHYDYDPRRNDFESAHVNATLAALFDQTDIFNN